MTIVEKLSVLSKIAKALNEKNIVWAVGGSLLLYFKGITDNFRDIDLMVMEEDVEELKNILEEYGQLAPANPNASYKTRYFLEFTIEKVEIDVMAGFVIVSDGKEYDCSLKQESIRESTLVNNVPIPLHSVDEWKIYYELMGRKEKVELIETRG